MPESKTLETIAVTNSLESFAPIAPRSLQAVVTEKLTWAILEGRLQAGSRLVEREIAESFHVSKTPVREALQELARRGLVVGRTYSGMAVRTVEPAFVREIYEVRAVVETEALRMAVPFHTDETRALVRQALDRASSAGNAHDLVKLSFSNRRFHTLLTEPCPNVLMRRLIDDVSDQVALITVAGWRHAFTWIEEATEHAAIFEAVEAKDADEAAERMQAHIRRALVALLNHYEAETPSDASQRR